MPLNSAAALAAARVLRSADSRSGECQPLCCRRRTLTAADTEQGRGDRGASMVLGAKKDTQRLCAPAGDSTVFLCPLALCAHKDS